MKDPQDSSLHQRIEQLEITVVEFQHLLRQLQQTLREHGIDRSLDQVSREPVSPPALPEAQAVPATSQLSATPSRPRFDLIRDGEFWLNRSGIGLLLLGVAFLFKYSVDQGWLTPPVRVRFAAGVPSTRYSSDDGAHAANGFESFKTDLAIRPSLGLADAWCRTSLWIGCRISTALGCR